MSHRILDLRVDVTTMAGATDLILRWARAGESRSVCLGNVHMLMEAHDDPTFCEVVNEADLVTADGMPLVWGLHRLGSPEAERVYGPGLTPQVCERAAKQGIPVGFYGSTDAVLARLTAKLQRTYPNLDIAYAFSPPFGEITETELADHARDIEHSGARILFVGLGCPKQERWVAAQKGRIPAVMLGVGAAFDFLAGTKRQAPPWMQRSGLEWLFRLVSEPRRLWRRYLYNNPRFLTLFGAQLFRQQVGRRHSRDEGRGHLGDQKAPRGYVLVVGPDGAGKTALADGLAQAALDAGVRVTRGHFRPGLLPPKRGDASPVTEPHLQEPRGAFTSLVKLALVFTDWMLSWWALWRRASKNGLVLVERGWWDMAVDPRRYRLANNLTGVTRTLGRLLPRPGYVLVCAGDPADLHARKPEIGEPEVQRQLAEWRRLAPEIAHTVVEVDTTKQSPYEAVSKVFESTARSKENWRLVPLAAPRLSLRAWGDPAALAVYRPFSKKARWSACFYPTFVRTGLGRQVGPPVPNISALARKLGWEITGLASFRSSAPGRWVIGVARLGSLVSVIKLGASDDRGLRSEAGWLNRLRSVQSPFRVPRLISHGNWQGHYYIATEAVTAVTSTATLNEAEMVAVSLAHGLDGFGPVVHGDLAPWNLLPTEDGLLVLDWEEARTGRDASGDLIRFVMRAGADLHRFSPANAARHILRATLARDGSVADVTEPLASLELELVRATEERDERLVRFIRKAAWYLDRCAMTLLSADETQGSRRGL